MDMPIRLLYISSEPTTGDESRVDAVLEPAAGNRLMLPFAGTSIGSLGEAMSAAALLLALAAPLVPQAHSPAPDPAH